MPSTRVRQGLYWSESTQTWHHEFRLQVEGVSRKFNGDTGQIIERDARAWLIHFKARLKKAEVGWSAPVPAKPLREGLAAWVQAHLGCAPGYPLIWRDIQMPSRISQELPNGCTILIHHALKKLIRKVIADRKRPPHPPQKLRTPRRSKAAS